VPQDPTYDDRMLTRLIREALFHRNCERWHLAAMLIPSSPFGSAVTDELLVKLEATIYPEWMCARLAIPGPLPKRRQPPAPDASLHRRQSNDVATFVIQGLDHPSYSTTSTRRSATGSARFGRSGPAKMCPEDVRRTRPARRRKGQGSATLAEAGAQWWGGARTRDHLMSGV
jgi:hypothetical protein